MVNWFAAVGSTQDFTGFNRTLDAKRQVGSLLKPIIYLNAIESGRYTWASPIEDSAVNIPVDGDKSLDTKNYSGGEHGVVSMQQTLANSLQPICCSFREMNLDYHIFKIS